MSDGTFDPNAFDNNAFHVHVGPTVRDRRIIPLLRRRTTMLAPPLKGRLWATLIGWLLARQVARGN